MRALHPASVVALVPCHEKPPTRELLDAVAAHVGAVLVVADGLPEDALRALLEIANPRRVSVLCLPSRSGKGSAVAAGLHHLLAETPRIEAVLVVDADGQHPPDAIPSFIAAAEGADLVIGDRFADLRRIPLVRRLANLVASFVVAITSRARVRDTQCGMRLLRGRALREVDFPAGGYEAETSHLKRCLAAGVSTGWVPIPAIYGSEVSSFRSIRDSIAVLRAAVAAPERAERRAARALFGRARAQSLRNRASHTERRAARLHPNRRRPRAELRAFPDGRGGGGGDPSQGRRSHDPFPDDRAAPADQAEGLLLARALQGCRVSTRRRVDVDAEHR